MRPAVLFDLDGTLANTLYDITAALNHTLQTLGYPVHTVDEVRTFVGNGSRLLVKRALPADTDESTVDAVTDAYVERYNAHFLIDTVAYDGLPALVSRFKRQGLALGVVTNKTDENAVQIVRRLFGQDFDFVLGNRPDLPLKPDPAMPRLVMREIGADPARTVFVGDSTVDVLTARALGVPGLIVSWGFVPRRRLEEAGAEQILDTPAELEQAIRGALVLGQGG